jgi:hypothetical protein
MTEYFECSRCKNRNRIDWSEGEEWRTIPCAGCRYDEEILVVEYDDPVAGSIVSDRLVSGDEKLRLIAQQNPSCVKTIRISHGADITAVKGKGN